MVREALREHPDVPRELALELEHLILSHHGAKELGSPVVPMTVEAFILAAADDLDAKMQQVQRHLADDTAPGRFTSYHRYLERVLLKPRLAPSDRASASGSVGQAAVRGPSALPVFGPSANVIVPSQTTMPFTRAAPLRTPIRLRSRLTTASISTVSPGWTGRR